MKKVLVFCLFVSLSNILFAQSEKYTTAMKKNIEMLDSAVTNGSASMLANNFERIGDAEKTQWLPYYYASYCTILSTYAEKDKSKIDAIVDKAEQLINKSELLAGKENSETAIIESMIASSHMMVDPMTRYMQYGKISSENLEKAKQLDPTNPRPLYLEGAAKFYTPAAFGGGKAPAEELLKKALTMFAAFKPAADLYPTWGKGSTEYFISLCHK